METWNFFYDVSPFSTAFVIPLTQNTAKKVTVPSGAKSCIIDCASATGMFVVPDATAVVPSSLNNGGYQTVSFDNAKTGASATGLTNDATTFTASISVDGTPHAISVVGSAAQTFTTLASEIQTDLASAGTVVITGGKLKVLSASTGEQSTVAISDTDLFSTLTDFDAIDAAVPGSWTEHGGEFVSVGFPLRKLLGSTGYVSLITTGTGVVAALRFYG